MVPWNDHARDRVEKRTECRASVLELRIGGHCRHIPRHDKSIRLETLRVRDGATHHLMSVKVLATTRNIEVGHPQGPFPKQPPQTGAAEKVDISHVDQTHPQPPASSRVESRLVIASRAS